MYFVHGTTTRLWGSATTVNPEREGGDFGAGFYTFEDPRWGREAAAIWARRRALRGGAPIFVRMRMPREVFQGLKRLDVPEQALDDAYRLYYKSHLTGYELVVGPVGVNGEHGERVRDYRRPLQYKFEGAGTAKLIFDSIIPIL